MNTFSRNSNQDFLVFQVVQILFKEKLGELSGNAQRSLFQTLERMIHTGTLSPSLFLLPPSSFQ